MYPASLIAAYFVNKGIETGVPITQMKLQKMVYFAQGVSLALNDTPLIKEAIEAWKYGPVVPIIYGNYKLYGSLPITDTNSIYNFPKYELLGLMSNPDVLYTLNYTWKATSHLSGEQLANWTHIEKSPWKQVYSPYDTDIVIPNESIKQYFTEFLGAYEEKA